MSTFLQDEITNCASLTVRASEVENVLHQHAAVAQCIVISSLDQVLGEVMHAIVAAEPGHGISAANLLRYCRRRLTASACVPLRSAKNLSLIPVATS